MVSEPPLFRFGVASAAGPALVTPNGAPKGLDAHGATTGLFLFGEAKAHSAPKGLDAHGATTGLFVFGEAKVQATAHQAPQAAPVQPPGVAKGDSPFGSYVTGSALPSAPPPYQEGSQATEQPPVFQFGLRGTGLDPAADATNSQQGAAAFDGPSGLFSAAPVREHRKGNRKARPKQGVRRAPGAGCAGGAPVAADAAAQTPIPPSPGAPDAFEGGASAPSMADEANRSAAAPSTKLRAPLSAGYPLDAPQSLSHPSQSSVEGRKDKLECPHEYLCPITDQVMSDPVCISSGHTYERSAIQDWLAKNPGCPTCPKTQERVDPNFIVSNVNLRALINDWQEESARCSPSNGAADIDVDQVLRRARGHADKQCFAEASRACVRVLRGPAKALGYMKEVIDAWEKCHRAQTFDHEDANRSMMAQIMASKDRCEALRQLKDKRETELSHERALRADLDRQCNDLLRQIQNIRAAQQENARLKRRIRELEASLRIPRPVSREEIVQEIAEIEATPLRGSNSERRQVIKKKLLLKWHPDKQPTADHEELATQVMQELQNRPEWSW